MKTVILNNNTKRHVKTLSLSFLFLLIFFIIYSELVLTYTVFFLFLLIKYDSILILVVLLLN